MNDFDKFHLRFIRYRDGFSVADQNLKDSFFGFGLEMK